MSNPPLTSTIAVINALGGTGAIAKLTGRGQSAACNWLWTTRFPPTTYLLLTQALADIGETAPAWLWGMEEAPSGPRPHRPATKAHATEVA